MRTGTRVLEPLRATAWLARDFGEDWVVPRAPVRYLVARSVGAACLLVAYGAEGQVIGERLFAQLAEARDTMQKLADDHLVEPWRDVPADAPSATRFLDANRALP